MLVTVIYNSVFKLLFSVSISYSNLLASDSKVAPALIV